MEDKTFRRATNIEQDPSFRHENSKREDRLTPHTHAKDGVLTLFAYIWNIGVKNWTLLLISVINCLSEPRYSFPAVCFHQCYQPSQGFCHVLLKENKLLPPTCALHGLKQGNKLILCTGFPISQNQLWFNQLNWIYWNMWHFEKQSDNLVISPKLKQSIVRCCTFDT